MRGIPGPEHIRSTWGSWGGRGGTRGRLEGCRGAVHAGGETPRVNTASAEQTQRAQRSLPALRDRQSPLQGVPPPREGSGGSRGTPSTPKAAPLAGSSCAPAARDQAGKSEQGVDVNQGVQRGAAVCHARGREGGPAAAPHLRVSHSYFRDGAAASTCQNRGPGGPRGVPGLTGGGLRAEGCAADG